jgi:hypothetical protein
MPKGYVIDAAGIQKLREDHDILRKMISQMQQKITGTVGAGIRANSELVKVTTQITQRGLTIAAGTTLGKGKAELYKISKDDNDVVKYKKITDSEGNAIEIDVYNSNRVPVAVDSYIRITRDFRSGLWMVGEAQTAIAKTSGYGISARSDTTTGWNFVNIYTIVLGAVDGVLTDTGENVLVHNLSSLAVAGDTYITIKKCSLDEDWVVDAEDCQ